MQVTYIDEHLAFGGDAPRGAVIPSFSSSITNVVQTTVSDATLTLDFLGDFEVPLDALTIKIEGFESPLIMSAHEYVADTFTFYIPQSTWADIIADGVIDIDYALGVNTQEGTEIHNVEEYLRLSISWDTFTNTPPKFIEPASLSIRENQINVATIAASDPDGDSLRYSIVGGDDAALFVIDSSNGRLSFVRAPDFEVPASADGSNNYQVHVQVSDGTDSASRLFTITVTDTVEIARFFNTTTGSHFYTANSGERDQLIANSTNYVFEGETFSSAATTAEGVPVYRFYNEVTGGHFYTADASEAAFVRAHLPQFLSEGEAFTAYEHTQNDRQAVFRFYNTDTKAHFYTSDEAERDQVLLTLPQFNYEGVGFYVDLA